MKKKAIFYILVALKNERRQWYNCQIQRNGWIRVDSGQVTVRIVNYPGTKRTKNISKINKIHVLCNRHAHCCFSCLFYRSTKHMQLIWYIWYVQGESEKTSPKSSCGSMTLFPVGSVWEVICPYTKIYIFSKRHDLPVCFSLQLFFGHS